MEEGVTWSLSKALKRIFIALLAISSVAGCSPESTSSENAVQVSDKDSNAELLKLLNEKKFQRTFYYTGPATSEDAQLMTHAVETAIRDILDMSIPRDAQLVRNRLNQMNDQVDLLDTEDRERVYAYSIKIWRAAGFTEESKLFDGPDSRVLADEN